MFVQIKCPHCGQLFDYDSSSGEPQADCPHCGTSSPVEPLDSKPPPLTVQHDAPTLAGVKTCPHCKAQIERDAVLCIHCGTNLATGQKAGGPNWLAAHKAIVIATAAGIVVAAFLIAFLFRPEPPAPPVILPAQTEIPAVKPPPPPARPAKPADPAPAETPAEAPAPPEPAPAPEPPPEPTPEELAAQQAEAERIAFAERKFAAEQEFRFQLDTREPLYLTNELVELRRRNGILNKGSLAGFDGTGTNRAALLNTPDGEVRVPLVSLDPPTRRRLDPEYREAFIQHVMSTRLPGPAEASAPQ